MLRPSSDLLPKIPTMTRTGSDLEPGAGNVIQVSLMGGRNPATQAAS